ncbi:hypothetical protein A3H12_04735 [Candidatus Uhrbacteria bacterium RIFCSPLOWO2_12_FULL_47_9]|nr:MAG: hypothetical protein A3H12_04735 [Candidatus Uhrbacteria bacterium RIFCSPLOWO2_12_FULL_47_9]
MDKQEITGTKHPLDYVKTVFRRKWLIIIPAVIGIIGGIIAADILPKEYETSTLILVEEGRVINPLIQGLAVSTSVAQRLAVLREQILGWDRINQLITKLDLAKNVKTQYDFENLVKQLRAKIQVKLYGNNIIRISYEQKDPARSMNVVKTITDIFIAENLRQQSKESENAINFINEELDLYKKKLKQSEVAGMEDQLKKLLVDSTEKHPMVIELRKKIAKVKQEVEEGNYEVSTGSIADSGEELKKLKEELKQLQDDSSSSGSAAPVSAAGKGGENRSMLASNTNEKIYKLLLLEKVDNVAKEDTNVNQKLYNELLKRLETAKITQRLEASKEGTRYTILDPARMPLKPTKPNRPLVLLMGLFVGLCSGVGLAFGVDILDNSFLGVDQAKAHLELPILGAVSKIITRADLQAQKVRNKRITGISVLVSVVLLIVIIFNVLIAG